MTEAKTPFDHRPDAVLGAALRDALQPGDGGGAAFVQRVLAAADRAPDRLVDVLAGWSRLGIAAAVVAALAAGILVGRGGRVPEPVVVASDPGALVVGVQAPDANTLLAGYTGR